MRHIIPDQPGSVDLIVTIDYTNDFNQMEVITETLIVEVLDQPIIEPPITDGMNGDGEIIPNQPETFLQKIWRFILGLIGLDSGINYSETPTFDQPIDTGLSSEEPIIVPAQPPLKGP